VVSTLDEQRQLIKEAHSGRGAVRDAESLQSKALGGHFGRDKTAALLQQNYYFPAIYRKVDEVIKYCDQCQRVNNGSKLDKGGKALTIIPVPKDTWKQIGIDLLGPLPESKGMKYIVTAIDYFTKWPEAKAIPDKKAETVAQFLYELICRYGVADIHITDQGTDFNNKCSAELCRLAGIKHMNTAAYHPQTNGLVEKQNDTTERVIFKHCEKAENWVDVLPAVMFDVRTSKHKSTGFTPMLMMFGREAVHPLFYADAQEKGNPQTLSQEERQAAIDALSTEEKMEKMQEFRSRVFDDGTYNIKKAQVSYKKHYDRRNAHKNLALGDKVMKKDMRNAGRKSKKGRSYNGPYTIIGISKSGGYHLKDKFSHILKRAVPPNQVKRYYDGWSDEEEDADGEYSGESQTATTSSSESKETPDNLTAEILLDKLEKGHDMKIGNAQSWDDLTEVEFVLSDGSKSISKLDKTVSFDEEDTRIEELLLGEITLLYGQGTIGQIIWNEQNALPPRNKWEATEGLSPAAMCIAEMHKVKQHAVKTVEIVAHELQQKPLGLSQMTTVVDKLLCKVVANLKGKLRFNEKDHTVSLTKASHPSPPSYKEPLDITEAMKADKPIPAPRKLLSKKKKSPRDSESESTVQFDTPSSDQRLFPTDTSMDDSDVSVVLGAKAAEQVFKPPPPQPEPEKSTDKLLADSKTTDVP